MPVQFRSEPQICLTLDRDLKIAEINVGPQPCLILPDNVRVGENAADCFEAPLEQLLAKAQGDGSKWSPAYVKTTFRGGGVREENLYVELVYPDPECDAFLVLQIYSQCDFERRLADALFDAVEGSTLSLTIRNRDDQVVYQNHPHGVGQSGTTTTQIELSAAARGVVRSNEAKALATRSEKTSIVDVTGSDDVSPKNLIFRSEPVGSNQESLITVGIDASGLSRRQRFLREETLHSAVGRVVADMSGRIADLLRGTRNKMDCGKRLLPTGDQELFDFCSEVTGSITAAIEMLSAYDVFYSQESAPKPDEPEVLRPVINQLIDTLQHFFPDIEYESTISYELPVSGKLAGAVRTSLFAILVNASHDCGSGTVSVTVSVDESKRDCGNESPRLSGSSGNWIDFKVSSLSDSMASAASSDELEMLAATVPNLQQFGGSENSAQVFGFRFPLRIANDIAVECGGYVEAEDIPPGRQVFRMSLPDQLSDFHSDYSEKPITILVVEDQEDVRKFASRCIRRLGYELRAACDANAAMQEIESAPNEIDLVLTDIRMPGEFNGIDLSRWIATNYPGMKTILMSGYAEELVALQPGIPVISKPFKKTDLERVLTATLIDRVVS